MADIATKAPVHRKKKTAPAGRAPSPMESLRREIDLLFDQFRLPEWRMPFGHSLAGLEPDWPSADWQIAPAMNLVEKNGRYEITAELPGIDKKNVEVKISNGTLSIKGEKSEEKEEREEEYYLSERRYGSFHRSFRIPDGVDVDRIEASLGKGVLSVRLPKTAEARKTEKKIEVKAA
jgi:HSP20 family protein